MSYCVNCGVELIESAKKCPLCDTPVINPNKEIPSDCVTAFPERIELPIQTKNRYAASIISLLLLIPNIVCILVNVLFTPSVLWSVYVVSSSAMCWFLFVSPFLLKKKFRLINILVDAVATCAYIYIFYYLNAVSNKTFFTVALPIVIGVFTVVAALYGFFSSKRGVTVSLIVLCAATAVISTICNVVINLHSYSVVTMFVTLIIAISALISMFFFICAEKNKKLKAWISRKLFY